MDSKQQFTHAEILEKLIPSKHIFASCYVGCTRYAHINQILLLKACLVKNNSVGYNALSLSIVHKQFGHVDTVLIPFPSYTTKNYYAVPKMLNVCVVPANALSWDEELTDAELAEIHEQVNNYIRAFDL
jgi:hypothetical protein